MVPELLDSRAVAKMLKCNRAYVYTLAKNHKIDIIVIGNRIWFTQEAVDKFFKDNTITVEDAEKLKG